ncbi:hypothetical protein DRP05_02080 [Archaeoglobales archaeon]|nr:MAG: hypothetical protein DRP05_02080 [Archaeoglobales archaeon]
MRVVYGEIEINDINNFFDELKGCNAVFIDADYVLDLETLKFAARKALKSWKTGRNVAKTLPIEVLLYIAARRQINEALKIGVKKGLNKVVVVLINDCLEILKRLGFVEKKFNPTPNIKKILDFYEIGKKELEIVGMEKLPLLIRERIVLFDLSK